jgi:hypothetical protein
VNSFFEKRNRTTSGIHLIGEEMTRKLLDYEEEYFEDEHITVNQASRLNKDYQVFHSKFYKKDIKSCSYLVKYLTTDDDEAFGLIEYFIRVNGKNQIYAYIQHIDAETNSINQQISPPDEYVLDPHYREVLDNQTLGYFYFVGCIVDSREFIPVEKILKKCISVSFGCEEECENFFFITDFDNENEHD